MALSAILRLLLVVGAAHALVALAGVAGAVRAHVDRLQLAQVSGAVVAAGFNGAANRLVHVHSSMHHDSGALPDTIMPASAAIIRADAHCKARAFGL